MKHVGSRSSCFFISLLMVLNVNDSHAQDVLKLGLYTIEQNKIGDYKGEIHVKLRGKEIWSGTNAISNSGKASISLKSNILLSNGCISGSTIQCIVDAFFIKTGKKAFTGSYWVAGGNKNTWVLEPSPPINTQVDEETFQFKYVILNATTGGLMLQTYRVSSRNGCNGLEEIPTNGVSNPLVGASSIKFTLRDSCGIFSKEFKYY